MTTYENALDEIFGLFDTAWKAGATAIVGEVPHVLWYGSEESELPDRAKYWARVSHKVISNQQSTLRNGNTAQRYTTKGILSVQIFCPFIVSKGITLGRRLAVLARSAYINKETTGGVWFRNGKIVEGRIDKDWVPLIVTVETEFDELMQ